MRGSHLKSLVHTLEPRYESGVLLATSEVTIPSKRDILSGTIPMLLTTVQSDREVELSSTNIQFTQPDHVRDEESRSQKPEFRIQNWLCQSLVEQNGLKKSLKVPNAFRRHIPNNAYARTSMRLKSLVKSSCLRVMTQPAHEDIFRLLLNIWLLRSRQV